MTTHTIFEAIERNDCNALRSIMAACSDAMMVSCDSENLTALMNAVLLGHADCARILLQRCPEQQLRAYEPLNGWTALMFACHGESDSRYECARVLLAYIPDKQMEAVEFTYMSALDIAMMSESPMCIRLLVSLNSPVHYNFAIPYAIHTNDPLIMTAMLKNISQSQWDDAQWEDDEAGLLFEVVFTGHLDVIKLALDKFEHTNEKLDNALTQLCSRLDDDDAPGNFPVIMRTLVGAGALARTSDLTEHQADVLRAVVRDMHAQAEIPDRITEAVLSLMRFRT
jgi:hypothetical protein